MLKALLSLFSGSKKPAESPVQNSVVPVAPEQQVQVTQSQTTVQETPTPAIQSGTPQSEQEPSVQVQSQSTPKPAVNPQSNSTRKPRKKTSAKTKTK